VVHSGNGEEAEGRDVVNHISHPRSRRYSGFGVCFRVYNIKFCGSGHLVAVRDSFLCII
jgi:hypothetical protein